MLHLTLIFLLLQQNQHLQHLDIFDTLTVNPVTTVPVEWKGPEVACHVRLMTSGENGAGWYTVGIHKYTISHDVPICSDGFFEGSPGFIIVKINQPVGKVPFTVPFTN